MTRCTYQLIDQGMEKGDIRFKSSQAIREVLSMGNIFNRHHVLFYVISRVRVMKKEREREERREKRREERNDASHLTSTLTDTIS